MRNTISPEEIRALAERFRSMAAATAMPEYVQLMNRAAVDLDRQAASLEARQSNRHRFSRIQLAQSLTHRSDMAALQLSA